MTFVNIGSYHTPAPPCGSTATVRHLLAGNGLLAGLPEVVLTTLAQHAQARQHASGVMLFHEGDAAHHCLLIETGSVEVLRHDADGEERMLRRFACGDLVAEAAMFMPHGRYPMSGRTCGITRVWMLPRSSWHAACQRHPELGLCLLQVLAERLYRSINEINWLTASKPPQRLAAYLLAQATGSGNCVALPTSQRQLATQLGIRAETLNRLLARWQTRGWIVGERRCWRLCDEGALRRLAAASKRAF